MMWVILAAAMTGGPLDLDLACPGQYADVESSYGSVSALGADGQTRSGTIMTNTTVMKPGVTRITLRGANGQITYPDGAVRTLSDVSADEAEITGSYKRLGLLTYRLKINRLTGDATVRLGRRTGMIAVCSVIPTVTQPKF